MRKPTSCLKCQPSPSKAAYCSSIPQGTQCLLLQLMMSSKLILVLLLASKLMVDFCQGALGVVNSRCSYNFRRPNAFAFSQMTRVPVNVGMRKSLHWRRTLFSRASDQRLTDCLGLTSTVMVSEPNSLPCLLVDRPSQAVFAHECTS